MILLFQSRPVPNDEVVAFLGGKRHDSLMKLELGREEAKDAIIDLYKEDRLRGEFRLFSIIDDDDEVADMANEVVREDKKGVVPEAKLTQIRQAHGSRIR